MKIFLLLLVTSFLFGCAQYQSKSLPEKTAYPTTPITLTFENVAALAVINNPALVLGVLWKN